MTNYKITVFSNTDMGQANSFLGGVSGLNVGAVTTMHIQDNDLILQDQANGGQYGETLDLNGQQVLAKSIGSASAGQIVQSVWRQVIYNSTTGQTGIAYAIRIHSGTSQTSPGSQVGSLYWASTIQVNAGDTISLSSTSNNFNGTVNYGNLVVCFARGTAISTRRGETRVENLRVGDKVLTRDRGEQPIRWIGSIQVSAERLQARPQLRPIRIKAGALGNAIPSAELLVSPQHRVLLRSQIIKCVIGVSEVLVAAKQLVAVDGIDIAEDIEAVEYFHILFDQHEIVISNGAESESLYTGTEALKSVGAAARKEILALFPALAKDGYAPVAAREFLSGRLARTLAACHAQNRQPLVKKPDP